MNTRRAVMKLIGAAPIAASSAKASAGALIGGHGIGFNQNAVQSAGQASISGLKHPQHVYDLHRQMGQEQNERERFRLASGGVDPDIASMRSLSGAYKRQKQISRNIEDFSMMDKFQKFLWGQG